MEEFDMKHLPQKLPEGLLERLLARGKLQKHALIYRKTKLRNPLTEELEPWIQVSCTACGESFYAEKVEPLCSRGENGWRYGDTEGETTGR